jgi:MOSC domain-containing protein YiiM
MTRHVTAADPGALPRGGDQAGSADDALHIRGADRGSLERIWLKRAKRGPMDPVDTAVLDADRGLRGNANRGGRRQVTIISRERWTELMDALGAQLPPSVRRANLMVSGLDLKESRGRILRIGVARLKINGETRPCERMEEAHAGLEALMRDRWGGGAFAEVLDGGQIRVGDAVEWEAMAQAPTEEETSA